MTILWVGLAVAVWAVVVIAVIVVLLRDDAPGDVVRRINEATRSTSPVPVENVGPARKPRATERTVLYELKRSGPCTARDLAPKFAGATPAIVAGLLVRLRGDGKVTSEQRRNLQVWTASS